MSESHVLPVRLCLGWGIGTFGVSIMFNSVTILMQRFATDFLGIAAATWGFIYLGSKVYDAVTDPLMGVVSDKTRSRCGRRRPYLLLGAVLSVAAFILLFYSPSSAESANAVLIILLGMLLFSSGYTVFNVPYMAMLTEMTQDYKQRARLVSYRVYAIALGTIVGLSLAPALINYFGGDRAAHHSMALVLAVLIFLAFVSCFMLTKDAEQSDADNEPKLGLRQSLALLAENKPFARVFGLKFLQLTSVAVGQTSLLYLIIHGLGKDLGFFQIYGLVSAICIMIGPAICLKLMQRHDKRGLYLIAALIHAAFAASWLLSSSAEPESLMLFRGAVLGMTAGAMLMTGQAMLPDAINYESLRTGIHREGFYSGLYTTAEKLAFATGVALSAFVLAAFGYVSSTTGSALQSESAIQAIFICAGLLPAILALLSCLFLIGYDLSEARLKELRTNLKPQISI